MMSINTAGLKNIKLPIRVMQRDGKIQDTVATIFLQAGLSNALEPNAVTSFTTILNRYSTQISVESFPDLLKEIVESFNAVSAEIEMSFPYYLEKSAPVTGTKSLMEYRCTFTGSLGDKEGFLLTVSVPVTTLCPCSKEISSEGAHNQRAEVTLSVRFNKMIWAEDVIELIEKSASCELFALLKRPDEKYVTEKAFANPMFVEDVVRKVAVLALEHPDIIWFSASVESFESIHKHSAYAYVDSGDIQEKSELR
ncbi:MAG: GTP cyclohydrolase I FolE2 [Desulfobulbaceae bacterium]|nr:MAG: GTP cyclohydrolase I FolE2 [Desulfobulbaceae bacterium]